MKTKIIFIFILSLVINFSAEAQFENINVKFGDHTFKTTYDTGKYETTLRILKNDKTVFKNVYEERIADIKEYDLNNDGNREILIEMYSGGAHCCTSLYLGRFIKDKFIFTDTVFWGNSYYSVEDLDKDGKLEISGSSDMFAYAFTNYAETKFPLMIYRYNGSKFVNVTSDYKQMINNQLEEFRHELRESYDTGFKCMEIDEDTFNTEAGSVKILLAVIVADYYLLGEVNKGYELVDSVYKCPDKEKYKEILQTDFKLK
ncbi:MAG TPA: hypothetical protein PKC91_12095 [Ignavibacteria bacterium]|nr:hypothetical protein [Ignavibacteria bacterium]